jgi:hypothetical protein
MTMVEISNDPEAVEFRRRVGMLGKYLLMWLCVLALTVGLSWALSAFWPIPKGEDEMEVCLAGLAECTYPPAILFPLVISGVVLAVVTFATKLSRPAGKPVTRTTRIKIVLVASAVTFPLNAVIVFALSIYAAAMSAF